MLDICSGGKTASAAMRNRGWRVVTVDIDPALEPDIVADVRDFVWHGDRPDLIWCSPPCNEFARESMPWCKTGHPPDLSLVEACHRIIRQANPVYWIIENVRGAVPYLGKPKEIHGPFYLWGHFPPLGQINLVYRKKESLSSTESLARAAIPYPLSLAVARAIELQPALFKVK